MGLFGDLIGTLFDMDKLSKLTEALEPKIEAPRTPASAWTTTLADGLEDFVQTLERQSLARFLLPCTLTCP